jgi:HK97 gp10 family phage protein
MAKVEVQGLRELGERMKKLSLDVALKASRSATNAAAQVIKKEAISKAPVDTGNLKKNIIVRRAKQPDLTSLHLVLVRSGKLTDKQKGSGLQDAFYWRFVEFGTVNAPPKPFMRPAFDTKKGQALDAMTAQLKKRIDKA